MKPEVLIVGPWHPETLAALEREFTAHRLWQAADRAALLADCGPTVRAVATPPFPRIDAALMDALPNLEIIASFGVGVDAIDLAAARERGVIVTNAPGAMNDCVADLTVGLMIAVARRICEGDRFVRAGRWRGGPLALGHRVSGQRLGIIGLGRIGRVVARRAEAFDMTIGYHNRRPLADAPYRYYATPVELAAGSDFLVVITPGGEATRHLVDERVLRALGPRGVLVNVARGSVVDEQALVHCLREGALGGAGLDVFANEPEVPEALFAMDNVVLAPHVGSATHQTRIAMGELALANLRAHFAGEPALTPVA